MRDRRKKGDTSRLEALREEVETLRQAVSQAYEDNREGSSKEGELAELTSRRNQLQREQRWAGILRAKLNNRLSALRGSDRETPGPNGHERIAPAENTEMSS